MAGERGQRYPTEVKERAVTMVIDHRCGYPLECQAMQSVAGKLDTNNSRVGGAVQQSADTAIVFGSVTWTVCP